MNPFSILPSDRIVFKGTVVATLDEFQFTKTDNRNPK